MNSQAVVKKTPKAHKGVRELNATDQLPNCEIFMNYKDVYDLSEICRNKKVADVGCGFGTMKKVVEDVGGTWIGIEPFEGGAEIVKGDAQDLPFPDNTFDVVLMHAVLEHVPNVSEAFAEVSRVLKPGGVFVGYVSFMESFHEISYTHMSHKSIEYFSNDNGMALERVAPEGGFGVAYNMKIMFHPFPFKLGEWMMNGFLKMVLKIKSNLSYFFLRWKRKETPTVAREKADKYYMIENLRQATGFRFLVRKI